MSLNALPALLWLMCAALVGCGQPTDPAASCSAPGIICTLVGTGEAALGDDGIAPAESALYLPQDVTVGPDGLVYVVDWNNHRVRRIDPDGRIRTVVGTGVLGETTAQGGATTTPLFHPTDAAFGPDGTLYVAVWHNNVVVAVDLASGHLTIVCGRGEYGLSADGHPAVDAAFDLPGKLAVDNQGVLYLTDQGNQRVRRITPEGMLETVFGPPATEACVGEGCASEQSMGFAGDGGRADEARFALPFASMSVPAGGIAFGLDGTLYLADTDNHRIRALSPDGLVSTVAGSGPGTHDPEFKGGYAGDGGPANQALLNRPRDVAVGPDGALYIADTGNACVRRVGADGIIATVAGRCGEIGDAGDRGPAPEALLNRPYGITVGPDGRLYIADTHNHRIRAVAVNGETP